MKTLDELVKERIGYKYLNADGKSPYQHYRYDLKSKRQMITYLNRDVTESCGAGWNLATLRWIADNCMKLDGIILECTIPKRATIIVPINSGGKFRTDIIKIRKIHQIVELFPTLKDINQRIKDYKPSNPITAEMLPDESKIRNIMAQVWAQVGVCTYYTIKEFLNLDYDHPAFDLIRLGIIVVNVFGVFKVFGNNGKYLGEFKE